MATYTISQCTIADGAALSRNNISTFWQDPTWILAWRHATLEQHIAQVAKRIPRNLLNDRMTLRYQKEIDPETSRLLGYARWILPTSHATNADGTPAWLESKAPAVGHEEEAEIRRVVLPLSGIRVGVRMSWMCQSRLCAVNPEKQSRGVATALVQIGIRQAEKMGLDIFVLAFKAGVGVYKRLGFHAKEELVQDDSTYGGTGEYGVYFMIYEQNIRSDV